MLSKVTHQTVVRVFECHSFALGSEPRQFLIIGFVCRVALTQLVTIGINLPIAESVNITLRIEV